MIPCDLIIKQLTSIDGLDLFEKNWCNKERACLMFNQHLDTGTEEPAMVGKSTGKSVTKQYVRLGEHLGVFKNGYFYIFRQQHRGKNQEESRPFFLVSFVFGLPRTSLKTTLRSYFHVSCYRKYFLSFVQKSHSRELGVFKCCYSSLQSIRAKLELNNWRNKMYN